MFLKTIFVIACLIVVNSILDIAFGLDFLERLVVGTLITIPIMHKILWD